MPYDCFISYSSTDVAFAEELNRRLIETREFTVWFDSLDLGGFKPPASAGGFQPPGLA
jgi:hypothetical protein